MSESPIESRVKEEPGKLSFATFEADTLRVALGLKFKDTVKGQLWEIVNSYVLKAKESNIDDGTYVVDMKGEVVKLQPDLNNEDEFSLVSYKSQVNKLEPWMNIDPFKKDKGGNSVNINVRGGNRNISISTGGTGNDIDIKGKSGMIIKVDEGDRNMEITRKGSDFSFKFV